LKSKEYKLFEANDIAKYGILSMASKVLSPLQYKSLMYLIWKCTQNTPGVFDTVTLSVTELCHVLGYAKDSNCNFSHARKKIGSIVEGLMSQKLTIYDRDEDTYISFVWVQTAIVSFKRDSIFVRFNTDLAHYFGQDLQKNFTVVKLKYLNRLSTTASVILYPFFCRYQRMHTLNYSVEEMAKLLTGNPNHSYKYLKRDFIIPAIKAINERTDLHIEFHENKDGKRVLSLSFNISKMPAKDEVECFMDFNGITYDELDIVPYNLEWLRNFDYDMTTQKYIPISQ